MDAGQEEEADTVHDGFDKHAAETGEWHNPQHHGLLGQQLEKGVQLGDLE